MACGDGRRMRQSTLATRHARTGTQHTFQYVHTVRAGLPYVSSRLRVILMKKTAQDRCGLWRRSTNAAAGYSSSRATRLQWQSFEVMSAAIKLRQRFFACESGTGVYDASPSPQVSVCNLATGPMSARNIRYLTTPFDEGLAVSPQAEATVTHHRSLTLARTLGRPG
eukprot:COSAG02_NODE_441_length_22281_cov_6.119556_20_plen_167_part_00